MLPCTNTHPIAPRTAPATIYDTATDKARSLKGTSEPVPNIFKISLSCVNTLPMHHIQTMLLRLLLHPTKSCKHTLHKERYSYKSICSPDIFHYADFLTPCKNARFCGIRYYYHRYNYQGYYY